MATDYRPEHLTDAEYEWLKDNTAGLMYFGLFKEQLVEAEKKWGNNNWCAKASHIEMNRFAQRINVLFLHLETCVPGFDRYKYQHLLKL